MNTRFSLAGLAGHYRLLLAVAAIAVAAALTVIFAGPKNAEVEFASAKNVMRLAPPAEGVLVLSLRVPLAAANGTVANKIVAYYDDGKPEEAEYKKTFESLDGAGTRFELPALYAEGEWHLNFFNGDGPEAQNVSYYLETPLWTERPNDFVLVNLASRKIGNDYNFYKAFKVD